MVVTCPGCGIDLVVEENHLGSVVRCRKCRTELLVDPPLDTLDAIAEKRTRSASWLVATSLLLVAVIVAGAIYLVPRLVHDGTHSPADESTATAPPSERLDEASEVSGPPIPPSEPPAATPTSPATAAPRTPALPPKRTFLVPDRYADLDFEGALDPFLKKWGNRKLTPEEYAQAEAELETVASEALTRRAALEADPYLARAEALEKNLSYHPEIKGRPVVFRSEFRPYVIAVVDTPAEENVKELARALVRLAAAVSDEFATPLGLARSDDPIPVAIFRARPPYPPEDGRAHDERRAWFDATTSLLTLAAGEGITLRPVLHAAAHQLASRYRIAGGVPYMVDEGVAEYFASLVRPESLAADAPHDPEPLETLRRIWKSSIGGNRADSALWIPLGRLLTLASPADVAHLSRETDPTNSREVASFVDAQAWSLVRHLVQASSGRYRSALAEYLKTSAANGRPKRDLLGSLGITDTPLFEVEWRVSMLELAHRR